MLFSGYFSAANRYYGIAANRLMLFGGRFSSAPEYCGNEPNFLRRVLML